MPTASNESPSGAAVAAAPKAPAIVGGLSEQELEPLLPGLRRRLLRQARFAMQDHGAAEDLVQDTLVAVVEQRCQHRQESSLSTWATAILKHKVADWYRSPTRQRTVQWTLEDDSLGSRVEQLYGPDGSYLDAVPAWQQPENRAEQLQMISALERCVDALPTQTGRVFMMREWLGFDNGEICTRLGINADHCRTILHRARMALRTCMQQSWLSPGVRQ